MSCEGNGDVRGSYIFTLTCTLAYVCAVHTHTHLYECMWRPQIGILLFSSMTLQLCIEIGALISTASWLRHSLSPPPELGLGELLRSHTFYMGSGIVNKPHVCKPSFSHVGHRFSPKEICTAFERLFFSHALPYYIFYCM